MNIWFGKLKPAIAPGGGALSLHLDLEMCFYMRLEIEMCLSWMSTFKNVPFSKIEILLTWCDFWIDLQRLKSPRQVNSQQHHKNKNHTIEFSTKSLPSMKTISQVKVDVPKRRQGRGCLCLGANLSRYGDYSIFLLGLAPVYLSNQHPLFLVLPFLVPVPPFGQSTSLPPFLLFPSFQRTTPVT